MGREKAYGICKEGVVISDNFLDFEIEREKDLVYFLL